MMNADGTYPDGSMSMMTCVGPITIVPGPVKVGLARRLTREQIRQIGSSTPSFFWDMPRPEVWTLQ